MKYTNPIIHADFSDPDVIRVNDDFYMIASSFNFLPGIPILHSKNLVSWSYIGYAINKLPSKFDKVCHGEGIWAPSIRYHNNMFYIVYPMPDEGIFEIHSKSIYGPWSESDCLIEGKGYEDPCPIWVGDKAYLVFSFVKSRIGFNSLLAVIEVDSELKHTIGEYKIVYDGHNDNPTIEGPKFYYINDYFYILAPSGSVKSGWQVALRSKNIYGSYESKIILYQGDTLINGPHQGGLVSIDDSNTKYSFIHFQDKRAYGRICHLQPVTWTNSWPLCGKVDDLLLPGTPVISNDYPIDIEDNLTLPISDDFKENKLSYMWQHPSNIDDFYSFNDGLIFELKNTEYPDEINKIPYGLFTKVSGLNFDLDISFQLNDMSNLNHFGFVIMGKKYNAIEFLKKEESIYIRIIKGEFDKKDIIVLEEKINTTKINITGEFRNKDIYDLIYDIKVNNKTYLENQKAFEGKWVGTKLGFYGYSSNDKGTVKINYYHTILKN